MPHLRHVGKYEVIGHLGDGATCSVFLGQDAQHQRYALKLLNTKAVEKTAAREVEALSKLYHPHVLRLFEVDFNATYYDEIQEKNISTQLIVLEFAPAGELFEFLAMTGSFNEDVARTFFRQLFAGLTYMHQNGVYHRDLKTENLLMDERFRLKIADFGFAGIKGAADADSLMYTEVGTPVFMAPEIYNNRGYDPAGVDVWAAAVVLFIMVSATPPFREANITDWWFQKLHVGKTHLFWQAHERTCKYSDEFKDLINKMFQTNPANRVTLQMIEQHPWFQGPVPSEEALVEEFSRRKAHINEEKAREKANALLNQMAQQGARADSAEVGDEQRVQRSAEGVQRGRVDADSDELPVGAPSLVGPVLFHSERDDVFPSASGSLPMQSAAPLFAPERNVASYTSFHSSAAPAVAFQRVGALFRRLVCQYETDSANYKVTFRLNIAGNWIAGTASIFAVPEAAQSLVVFRRKQGDLLQYQALFSSIREQLKDIIMAAAPSEAALTADSAASHPESRC